VSDLVIVIRTESVWFSNGCSIHSRSFTTRVEREGGREVGVGEEERERERVRGGGESDLLTGIRTESVLFSDGCSIHCRSSATRVEAIYISSKVK